MINDKVSIITSGQPSANPRLVKEALFLANRGYKVSVIYCPLSPWADTYDKELFLANERIKFECVGYHSERQRILYLFARLRRKFFEYVFIIFGDKFDAAVKSLVLFSQELKDAALSSKSDIYIGHNLGSMAAVVGAAQNYSSRVFFDFEDFHRGESSAISNRTRAVISVENKYIPYLNKAYTASPLITGEYEKLFPSVHFETINNYFPFFYRDFDFAEIHLPLKLFWFSQYLGKNRGLEQIMEAIALIPHLNITLTLLGNADKQIKTYFEDLWIGLNLSSDRLIFLPPVKESDIVKIGSRQHIGLAVEIPHILNRDLCLTNKIFMYLLSGNAILYSSTSSQRMFYEDHPNTGSLFEHGNVNQIAGLLRMYYTDLNLLNSHRKGSFDLAEEMNWEKEGEKIIRFINDN